MKLSSSTYGALLTVISALGFSTLPLFGVAAYADGANVTTLLGVRFLIASVLLWAYLLITRTPMPDRRTGLQLLGMGACGYTLMSVLYLSSVAENRLSPSLAALLLYSYPAIVAVEAWWFDKQVLTWRQGLAMALSMAGLILVLLAPGAAIFTPLGAGLALASAFVYGTYILFGSRVTRHTTPAVATTYVTTAAAVVFLGYGALAGELVPVGLNGWLAIAGTAVFSTVVAVLLFFAGIERLGPSRASIISTMEPVGTAVLSALLFADWLSPLQIVGGLLVLAGVVWLQFRG